MRRFGKLFSSIGVSVALIAGCVPASAMAQVNTAANESTENTAIVLTQDASTNANANENTSVAENVASVTSDTAAANESNASASSGSTFTAESYVASDKDTQAISPSTDIEKFVYRLYSVVLDRVPDLKGYNVQVNALKNGAGAAAIARNFLISKEFSERELSDEDRVEIAYRALLDRECEDEDSLAFWVDHLTVGMSFDGIAKGFCESKEFSNNCAKWGVNVGAITTSEPRDYNYYITKYAYNLYKIALDRIPDTKGLNTQCQALISSTPAARIAENFMISAEFNARGLSAEEQIEIVYQCMLGRKADSKGMAFWKTRFEVGMTAGAVVAGFSEASEFKTTASKYCVNGAKIEAFQARDKNYEVTKFVHSFYADALQRTESPAETDSWCCFLYANNGATEAAVGVLCSSEFTNGVGKTMSNKDFVKVAYRVVLGREADSVGLTRQVALLDSGQYATREDLVRALCASDEFATRCSTMGVRRYHRCSVEDLIEILDKYSVGNQFTVFGTTRQLSSERYQKILDAIEAIYAAGKNVGFTMIDLNTGCGISYNSDVVFSSACSVKGPYTIALNQYDPSSLNRYESLMYPALDYSNNETYQSYFYEEGTWPIDKYISRGHVTSFSWTGWTARYTAEDLCRMWVCSADYLLNSGTSNAEWLKSVLSQNSATMSRNAALRYGIGTVYAKSGWMETARTEGALVMAGDNPYVTGIMTNGNINDSELVTDLAAALFEAHAELVA